MPICWPACVRETTSTPKDVTKFSRFERHFKRAKSHNQGQALHVIHGLYPGDLPGLDPGCPPILSA